MKVTFLRLLSTFLMMLFLPSIANAVEVQFAFECESVGTKISGERQVKIKETFAYTEKDMKGTNEKDTWKIKNSKFFSDGKEYKAVLTSQDEKFALFSYASQEGKGFNTKVNSFLFFIDFAALSLERVVVSFPQGGEERVRGTCKRVATK